jgi:hypothetical protein
MWLFLDALQSVADALETAMETATETTRFVFDRTLPRPKNLDRRLYRAIRYLSVHPPADTMRICLGIVTGEVESVYIRVIPYLGKGGEQQVTKAITAKWKMEIPADKTVWLSDATGNVDTLRAIAGCDIQDMTPTGRLDLQKVVAQIPVDITRGTSVSKVAAILRGVLREHAEAQRAGVIGHSCHVKPLFTDGPKALDKRTRERVAKWCYFVSVAERSEG